MRQFDFYHPDLGHVAATDQVIIGDVGYPAGWLQHATQEQRSELGFFDIVTEGAWGDSDYYVNTQEYVGAVHRLSATPREVNEVQLAKIGRAKADAAALLGPTDWMIVRAIENPTTPVPPEITAYRAAVRQASNDYEAAVNGCVTLEDLMVVPPPSWPE